MVLLVGFFSISGMFFFLKIEEHNENTSAWVSVTQVHGEWQIDVKGLFAFPFGLALTTDEAHLLVADQGNRRVAVLQAVDGTLVRALTGPLCEPVSVVVVPSTGEVLVADGISAHRVVRFRSIDDDTVIGNLGTGQGSGPTEFNIPLGLAVLDPHCSLVCIV